MSLVKIPFIFLFGLGAHVTYNPPNPPTPKKQGEMGDSPFDVHVMTFIVRQAYWVHAAIELTIILAAALPKSTVTKSVLTFLLPGKDPSHIVISPVGVFATALVVIGGAIRLLCYREMGKHFTFQVTLLKDHKLIKSGPYSYVRHPGYISGCLSTVGMVIWFTVQGSWLRESEIYKISPAWLIPVPLIWATLVFQRVYKEDKMLREAFGKEWDEWAKKVPARLVPGIY